MKKVLVLVIAILLGFASQAQNRFDSDGEKTGHWEKAFDNGKTRYQGQFEKGYEIGKFTYYFPNGNVKSIMTFSEKGAKAEVINFYKTGKKLSTGAYFNKKKDGVWNFYNIEEKLVKKERFSKGKKDGVWAVYYAQSNTVASEISWKNGVKDGDWKEYFENGQLKLTATFVNGKLDGDYLSYFLNKKLARKGKYVAGKQDGTWISYDDKGGYKSIYVFDMGYVEKETRYEDGKMILSIDNKNNKVIDYRKNEDGGEE